jgi:uncharacterized protein DUF3499
VGGQWAARAAIAAAPLAGPTRTDGSAGGAAQMAEGDERGGQVSIRRCSRTACKQPAVCTLTYVYRDSTAVLGPLASYVEPHCYDLCAAHAQRLTAPLGWEVVRLPVEPAQPDSDDLEALANAVREAARPQPAAEPVGQGVEVGRRGHLRVLRSAPPNSPGG